jgi:aryl-alcohol dehydrogenase-like predicted oxidoreductase
VVGLGCNNFGGRLDAAATARVVHAVLDAGINFLDTADIYGGTRSEEYLGRALAGRRDQVVLAGKFGMAVDERRRGARPDHVRRVLEDSLCRLKTERIDLSHLHQPDPEVPIADTLGWLDELAQAGKVREIGCSNFSAEQLREAHAAPRAGAARFVSVQNEYSLLQREPEPQVLAECERLGLASSRISRWPADCSPGSTGGAVPRRRAAGSRPAGGSRPCSRRATLTWSRSSPGSRPRAAIPCLSSRSPGSCPARQWPR